jgi:hypothetical protein
MPGCIFMHTCLFPENRPDHDPRCYMAPGIIVDKAAFQQAALCVHPKRPRRVPV